MKKSYKKTLILTIFNISVSKIATVTNVTVNKSLFVQIEQIKL